MEVKEVFNLDVRCAIEKAGIKHWQVAEVYGYDKRKFSAMLSGGELPSDTKSKLLDIIERLKNDGYYGSRAHGKRSVKLRIAKQMPQLRHSFPNQEFDIMNSEVCEWLIQQPDIRSFLYSVVCGDEIVFNPDTGTWQGKDYAT